MTSWEGAIDFAGKELGTLEYGVEPNGAWFISRI
jgi:hypothetical protein